MARSKGRPICAADDAEKVARHGFGMSDEDMADYENDQEYQDQMNAARAEARAGAQAHRRLRIRRR